VSLLLLDTTFLIDAERSTSELDALIDDDDDIAIAAITVAELAVGVQLASARQRQRRQAYLDDVIASIPILPYDRIVAIEHTDLLVSVRRSGRPRGAHDLIIAATARAFGRTLVSADRHAFDGLPGVTAIGHRPA
jgi:tRNA(fMet)-specific endonuclease VapC